MNVKRAGEIESAIGVGSGDWLGGNPIINLQNDRRKKSQRVNRRDTQ